MKKYCQTCLMPTCGICGKCKNEFCINYACTHISLFDEMVTQETRVERRTVAN